MSPPGVGSARPTIPGQGIIVADRGASGGGLDFGFGVTSLTETGTVPGDAAFDHDLADVRAVHVADADASVMRALAVEFAPKLATLNQLEHGLGGGGTTGFVPLGRSQTIETDRHAADNDRVAVPDVGDLAGQGTTRALRGVGRRSE